MAQNGSTGINAGAGLDLVGDFLRVANALGNDDNEVALTGALRCNLIGIISRWISNSFSGRNTAMAPEAMATFRAM